MSDEEEFHASGPKCTSGEGFMRRKTHVGIGVHASGNTRWGINVTVYHG